jgi:ribonucleases P/MRP protein subunit RPP40
MRGQMLEYLMLNKLLDPLQSGFKCGSVLTLLDFSKAFESIDHELLLMKLSNNFNFSSSAISMIRAYVTGRSQCVCVDGVASERDHITTGVPQGYVLGPLLFCLLMNDISEVMKHCKYHIYADDVQLYILGKYDVMGGCEARLNDDLACIQRWSMSNGLLLNPD